MYYQPSLRKYQLKNDSKIVDKINYFLREIGRELHKLNMNSSNDASSKQKVNQNIQVYVRVR